MIQNSLFDSLTAIVNSGHLSFSCKIKILEDILSDSEAVDSLGLKLIELIDQMLKMTNEKSEKRELIEIKLLAFQTLYYPENFLLKNGIDLRKIFLEYLDQVKYEYVSEREARISDLFICADIKYAKDIEDHLLNFLGENDKILLLFKMNQRQLQNAFNGQKNFSALEAADYYHRINERIHVILQVFLVTHIQKSDEIFYLDFPIRYVYENVCTDWYWTEKTSYDYYTDNKIISEKESDILYKIGSVLSNCDLKNTNTEYKNAMLELFDEFVDDRSFTDVIFPDFLSCKM